MMKIENLFILGIQSLSFLVFQGCYTQLAINKQIVVAEQSVYQSQEKNFSQFESFPDTLQNSEISPDTIVEEHYWLLDPYSQQFGYDPLFNDPGFYHSFHFTYSNSYWYPWHYTRYQPYWSGYYYTGWSCYDPFWYDPYLSFAYSPGYYSGYYSGYWYPYWGWYQPVYITDPIPDKKRDWDRRGSDLTNNTIVRPSNSSAGQGLLVSAIDQTETGTSTINRIDNNITKPIRQTEVVKDIKKPRIQKRNENKNKSRTVKRIYHTTKNISHSNRSHQNDNKKANNSKSTTVSRNTSSQSNHSAAKQVHRTTSRSNVRSHSTSYNTGHGHSGKSYGRSSKSRSNR